MGEQGKGTGSDIAWANRPIIRTISLAKTLGCHGGAIAGSEKVIHGIKTQSPVWSGHTPFPVSLGEACSTSLSVLSQDTKRRQLLEQNVVFLRNQLEKSTVLPSIDVRFPVLSFLCDHIKSPEQRAQVEAIFVQHGVYPSIIRYAGSNERLLIRLALSSSHPPEDIQILMTVLESVHKAFGIQPFLMSDIQ
jgi:7-keto-8-aminopelargonate synthetase-like enzyme